jgi:tRNA(fMet)-specific endonuclease VapC
MLDTNICIHVISARPPAVLARFRQERLSSIGISSVTAAELGLGVAKSGSARNRETLEMFLAPLEVLPFDESTIWHYGELRAELERRGQPIGALDTMIAAHALASNTILVTNNTREFSRVPELRLQNWAGE